MTARPPDPPSDPVGAVTALVQVALAGHVGPGPLVLGIDGRSGSGKSELARGVAARLAEVLKVAQADGGVTTLALEDSYRGWDGLREGLEVVVAGILAPLTRGRHGRAVRYDWVTGALDGELLVPAPGAPMPRVLVVEGCGAGSLVCAPFLDLLVWLDAPERVRRHRALTRDGGGWAHLWDSWAAQEQALLDERDARVAADLVLRTG
ncbi:hypothetical protein FE374_07435 [Georgenia yuyongxinii]|uniref:Uridine kinase n=1 Tax=Georgenia yuyongxinii TaxID=2589797 RepID=A0A5B8C2B7_9MICO|nr:hypothetical protein [Georgenia yuyongxinii]QDC24478.1 hypothetical protein FE374_07435 [Georgenia yuyongxinii]